MRTGLQHFIIFPQLWSILFAQAWIPAEHPRPRRYQEQEEAAKAPWLQRAGLNLVPVTSSRVGHPGGFSCLLLQIMQRPVLRLQLGETPAQQGGGTVGTGQGAGDTQGTLSGGPSPPTQLWL